VTKKKKARPAKKNLKKPFSQAVPADEIILYRKIKKGNEQARHELLSRYSVWVTNIARKYHALFPNIDISELEAEGNRGLLEAVDRFDPSKRVKFSTYSWFWIIKNIQEYITSSINLIGVPAKVMSDLKMIIGTINEGIKKGKNPSLKEVSDKLGIGEVNVGEMLANKKNVSTPLSLDMYLSSDDREERLADIVEDKKLDGTRRTLDGMDDKKMIFRLLAQLTPMEQQVLSMRYGLKNNKSKSLNEISVELGLSPSKVKDIESIAFIKLKRFEKKAL
jgi:RNA polymerase sigma factor (sigma-70 family)